VNCIDFDYCADCFRNLVGEHNPSHAFQAMHARDNSLKLPVNDLYRPAGRVIELGDVGGYAGGYPMFGGPPIAPMSRRQYRQMYSLRTGIKELN